MFGFLKNLLNINFLVGALFVAVLGVVVHLHIQTKNLQLDLANEKINSTVLVENVSKLRDGILQSEETVDYLVENFAEIAEIFKITEDEMLRIRQRADDANEGFTVPDTTEAINKQASDMNRCFELLSGSPLNEREKNANDPEDFNSECPWLFVAD